MRSPAASAALPSGGYNRSFAKSRSQSEQPPIHGEWKLRPHRNPPRVRVARVDDDVQIAPAGYDGRNDQQSGPPVFDPVSTEVLRDREIAQIVPAGVRDGVKRLSGNVVGDDGLDAPGAARGRLPVGMDENFDQAEGEAGSHIDRRQAGRIPALAEQAGSLPGPDGVDAGDDAPEPKGQGC